METMSAEALRLLLQVFTPEQLAMIAERCVQVQAGGYGAVEIQFQAGHPRFITPGKREELPKSKNKD